MKKLTFILLSVLISLTAMAESVKISRQGWSIEAFANPATAIEGDKDGRIGAAIDGVTHTFFHTKWGGDEAGKGAPHIMIVDLGSSQTITQLGFMNRQDTNAQRPGNYRVFVSENKIVTLEGMTKENKASMLSTATRDITPTASGTFDWDGDWRTERIIPFTTAATGRYITFIVDTNEAGEYLCCAEFYAYRAAGAQEAAEIKLQEAIQHAQSLYTGDEVGAYNPSAMEIAIAAAESALTDSGRTETSLLNAKTALETACAAALKMPQAGKMYQIVSALPAYKSTQGVEKAIYLTGANKPEWATVNSGDVAFYWYILPQEDGTYSIASYGETGKYISGVAATGDQPVGITLKNLGQAQFNLILNGVAFHTEGHKNGQGISGALVNWDGDVNSASAWHIREYDPATIEALFQKNATIQEAKAALYATRQAAITSATQFFSPYTIADGQGLTNEQIYQSLLQNNDHYWHSDWNAGEVGKDVHYLQVAVTDLGMARLEMGRRHGAVNDHPTKLRVKGYTENNANLTFEQGADLGLLTFPYKNSYETLLSTETFDATGYTYLRFYWEESNGTNQRGYWHCGTFQIYPQNTIFKAMGAIGTNLEAAINAIPADIKDMTEEQWQTFEQAYTAFQNMNIPASISYTFQAKYGTLMLPFDANIPEGMKAYTCGGVDGNKLILSEAQTLFGGMPYIVENVGVQSNYVFKFNGLSIPNKTDGTFGALTGLYEDGTAPVGTYVLQNQPAGLGFYLVDAEKSVSAYRCYLTVPASPVKAFYFNQEEGTTAIDKVANTAQESTVYNLSGQRLQQLRRGINIVNNKKILK